MRRQRNICDLPIANRPLNSVQGFNLGVNLTWRVLALAAVLILVLGMAVSGQQEGSKSAKPETSAAASSESQPLDLGGFEVSNAALDADVAKDTKEKDEPVLVTVGSFIFKLAIVLVLAYASIYALKRFTGLKNAVGGNRRRIKVVENANLGTNRCLHLIEVGAKTLLVGSTPSQISLITELGAEDMPADAGLENSNAERLEGSDAALQPVNFQTLLAGQNVAQMVRGSSTFLQDKILQLGRLRRKLKDG